MGIKIFVTVHTADTRDNRKINWKNFYSTVLEDGEIIVHNSMSVKSIEHFNLHTQKVHVIAHGTEFLTLPSKELARNQLHLKQDDFIFIILGFIHALKNHHTVISAFNLMKKKRRVKLLIAGSAGGNHFYNKLYIQGLKLLSLFNRNIIWHNRFVKDEDLPIYLAASDVLLLPYWQNYPSASGIFHLGLGARLPVICSDSVKFSEVKPYLKEWKTDVFVPVLSTRKWIKAMSRYIENPDAGQKISIALNDYAMETSWENIAKQHLALYKKDLK
ncbi:MAG: glycosyltransferase [Deltaproteobacteria bacterium]|nr:glycosyltransferase [Deltaproteobacteria bacterium]